MNKTAMIWGVSGGIGRAIARQLQQADWTVVGISRHPEDVADVTHYGFSADASRGMMYKRPFPPLSLPKDAAPPEKVAKRILSAYDEGHSGQLDLV